MRRSIASPAFVAAALVVSVALLRPIACAYDWRYSPGDAGAAESGPPDAAPVDAGAKSGCDAGPAHFFCDDFDEGKPVAWGWDQATDVSNGAPDAATLALDPVNAKSPPLSVHSALAAQDWGADGAASLVRTFQPPGLPSPFTRMQVALDMRITTASALPVLLVTATQERTAFCRFALDVTASLDTGLGSVELQTEAWGVGGSFLNVTHVPMSLPFTPGAWTHAELDVDTTALTASVSLDGRPGITTKLDASWCGPPGTSASLLVGADFDQALDACRGHTRCDAADMWFDNVTLDVAP